MKAIVQMFDTLHIENSNELSLDEYKKQIESKEEVFAQNNQLCKLIDAYANVFEMGEADNGVSSVIDEARLGVSIYEIMKRTEEQ